jgi:PadR family transcriptional regulator PadR
MPEYVLAAESIACGSRATTHPESRRSSASLGTRAGSTRLPCDLPLLPYVYLFYNIEPMKKHRFGSLELTVLNAVARLGEQAYGLGVRRDVSELLGHDYSVGAIYTTLARLEEQGLLRSSTTAPLPVRGGRSRRQFRLSPAGRAALREAERLAVRMLDLNERGLA